MTQFFPKLGDFVRPPSSGPTSFLFIPMRYPGSQDIIPFQSWFPGNMTRILHFESLGDPPDTFGFNLGENNSKINFIFNFDAKNASEHGVLHTLKFFNLIIGGCPCLCPKG